MMANAHEEQDMLAAAQRRLLEQRRALGEPAAPAIAPIPYARALATDAGRFGAGQCARCGSAVSHPGICAGCDATLAAEQRRDDARIAIEREIPERYRWARWDRPELLVSRVAGGSARVAAARSALASTAPVVVLLGPGRRGKSSLAAAWLRGELEAGHLGARWVAARELGDDVAPEGRGLPYDRAVSAGALVLDDLGAELATAPIESGLCAQRAEPAIRLFGARYDRRARGRVVVTTAIGFDIPPGNITNLRRKLAEYYGDGLAGRVYEHAKVVRIDGQAASISTGA